MTGIVWQDPRWLWLMPLVLLPLWQRGNDGVRTAHVNWMPRDRLGAMADFAMRVLAALAIGATLAGLAGPERPESFVARTGRGAEIALLLDRSSSMDEEIRHNGRDFTSVVRESKAQSMRHAFASFIARRPNDRYALVLFASSAMRVLPFTEDVAAIRAGLAAASIGRGLSETNIGSALLAGIEAFQDRAYTGSRVIVLVSDGGAVLDPPIEARIREGLARERIGLYFIYIRSATNSPDLEKDAVGPIEASTPEWVIHQFFKTLKTPYRVFQTKDPASIGAAVGAVDAQQNLPLIYQSRVPKVDLRGAMFLWAACAGALLLALRALSPGGAGPRPMRSKVAP